MTKQEFEKLDLLTMANAYAQYLEYELIGQDPEIMVSADRNNGVRIYTRANDESAWISFRDRQDLEQHIYENHDNFFEMMADYQPYGNR